MSFFTIFGISAIGKYEVLFSFLCWYSRKALNRPTAEKANFESCIGLLFNLLSVKVFDKNRKT